MTAFLSAVVHLFAMLRGWLDDRRGKARDDAVTTAETNRIAATTQTEAREAEHAAQTEMAEPRDRGVAAQRMRDGSF